MPIYLLLCMALQASTLRYVIFIFVRLTTICDIERLVYCRYGKAMSKVSFFYIFILCFSPSEVSTLETLDFAFYIGSTPTILYVDLYFNIAYAAYYVY